MTQQTVDEKPINFRPGHVLRIPRDAIHHSENNGSQDAKVLCVISPAAIGQRRLREGAEVTNEAGGGELARF